MLQEPFTTLIPVPDWGWLLNRLLWGLVILLVTWGIAARVRTMVLVALKRTGLDINFALLLARMAFFGIIGFGIVLVLQLFELNWATLAAGVGAIGIAISLGIQDVLRSFVAGTYLLAERPFRIGDRVTVKDQTGVVQDVSVRTTTLVTDDGQRVVVPNTVVFAEVIKVHDPSASAPPATSKTKAESK